MKESSENYGKKPGIQRSVNWVTPNIRRMVRKRVLERLETKLANCEVTPQTKWAIAKSLTKRGGSKALLQFMVPQAPYFIQSIKPT
jgi:hypothetical protein